MNPGAGILLFLVLADSQGFPDLHFYPTPHDDGLEKIVEQCVDQVHREVGSNNFDAFVDGAVVNSFGNDRERFKFDKCLSKHGEHLSPITDDERK